MGTTPLYQCSKCDSQKALSEFPPSKTKNKYQWCRECLRFDQRRIKGLSAAERVQACLWCGDTFDTTFSKALFCSRRCKQAVRARNLQNAIDAAKPQRRCVWCGAGLPNTMRADAKFCSADCNSKAHGATRTARRIAKGPRIGPLLSFIAIAERDNWRCGLCGGRVSPKRKHPDPLAGSLDHVVPVSLGGSNDPSNLQLAHLGCNCSKRNDSRGEQLRLL